MLGNNKSILNLKNINHNNLNAFYEKNYYAYDIANSSVLHVFTKNQTYPRQKAEICNT